MDPTINIFTNAGYLFYLSFLFFSYWMCHLYNAVYKQKNIY